MFMAITVLIDHGGSGTLNSDANQNKPIRCADFAEVTGHGIHHPKALGFFSQVFGTVGQQVSTADPVITLGAGEVKQAWLGRFCSGARSQKNCLNGLIASVLGDAAPAFGCAHHLGQRVAKSLVPGHLAECIPTQADAQPRLQFHQS
jgi:hypothetical protein